jgi:hypothetical protein
MLLMLNENFTVNFRSSEESSSKQVAEATLACLRFLTGNNAYFPFQRTELYKTDTSQTWCVQQQQHQHQLRSRSISHLHKRVNYRKTTICAAATRTVQLSCRQLQQHRPKSNSNSG